MTSYQRLKVKYEKLNKEIKYLKDVEMIEYGNSCKEVGKYEVERKIKNMTFWERLKFLSGRQK